MAGRFPAAGRSPVGHPDAFHWERVTGWSPVGGRVGQWNAPCVLRDPGMVMNINKVPFTDFVRMKLNSFVLVPDLRKYTTTSSQLKPRAFKYNNNKSMFCFIQCLLKIFSLKTKSDRNYSTGDKIVHLLQSHALWSHDFKNY